MQFSTRYRERVEVMNVPATGAKRRQTEDSATRRGGGIKFTFWKLRHDAACFGELTASKSVKNSKILLRNRLNTLFTGITPLAGVTYCFEIIKGPPHLFPPLWKLQSMAIALRPSGQSIERDAI
jgi:hypothetical protein